MRNRTSKNSAQPSVNKNPRIAPAGTLERMDLDDLIGANAGVTAAVKAHHETPNAITNELPDIMKRIEDKFNSGVYDAAVMPLIHEYLDELKTLAKIQNRRSAVVAQRVSDAKEANAKAFQAVSDARNERTREIRTRYEEVQHRWSLEQNQHESAKKAKRETKAQVKADKIRLKARRNTVKAEQRIQRQEDRLTQKHDNANRKMALQYRREAENELAHEREAATKAQKDADSRALDGLKYEGKRQKLDEQKARFEVQMEEQRQELKRKQAELEQEAASVDERKSEILKRVKESEAQNRTESAYLSEVAPPRHTSFRELKPAPETLVSSETTTEETIDTPTGSESKKHRRTFSEWLKSRRKSREESDSNDDSDNVDSDGGKVVGSDSNSPVNGESVSDNSVSDEEALGAEEKAPRDSGQAIVYGDLGDPSDDSRANASFTGASSFEEFPDRDPAVALSSHSDEDDAIVNEENSDEQIADNLSEGAKSIEGDEDSASEDSSSLR